MTNVCCSKLRESKCIFNSTLPQGMMGQLLHLCDNHRNLKLDSCFFECFKLVIQKQNKHWPCYKQLKSHSAVWLLINCDVGLIRYKLFLITLLLMCPPLESYRFNWLILNYLISLFFFFLSFLFYNTRLQRPRLNLSISGTLWQTAVTSGSWLEGVSGVWPHLLSWHLVWLKREDISWLSEMMSLGHRLYWAITYR